MKKAAADRGLTGAIIAAISGLAALNLSFLLALFLPGKSISCQFVFAPIAVLNALALIFCAFRLKSRADTLRKLHEEKNQCSEKIKEMCAAVPQKFQPEDSQPGLTEQLEILSRQLSEIRKKERSIIDKAVDVICVIDIQSCFISVSPSAEKSWGYKPDELIGRPVSMLLLSEDNERSLEVLIGARHSIEKTTFENRARTKDGRIIDLSWSAHWSISDMGLFCIVHDVTERKQAEERLKESEQRLRNTLEAMPVGVLCAALNGVIEYANPVIERFSLKARADLLGATADSLISTQDRSNLSAYLRECSGRTAGSKPLETEVIREDGQALPVEVEAIKFAVQGIEKYLITVSDISVRKEKERLKREFTSMINHDLRSPLTSILGLISLIQAGVYGELIEKGQEVCAVAVSETERLIRLINDLLDLDKLQSGQLTGEMKTVRAADIIGAATGSLNTFAHMREIELRETDTALCCHGDRERLIQVLVNLLSNAIKFSREKSSVEITTEKSGDFICFNVSDSGRGIPESKQASLFVRYKQVNPSDAVEKSGSGLGLSISKAIVEAHGGQIGCRSSEGKGSTFWFTIPAAQQES